MQREFRRLDDGPFDLLVIGGGIYGSWIAYDAAQRGLKVALVEKTDWAAGTSSNSSKLLHGGLRYLEQFKLGLVRRSLDERRRLWKLAPHRITRLRFVLPRYAGDRVGRIKLGLGLWLYDQLARTAQPVARHQSLGRQQVLDRCPFLKPEGLQGGFTFGDCQTDDARFTLEIVDGAMQHGAVAVNHARARSLLSEGRRITGAVIEDAETGRTVEVHAAVTANCSGPWCNGLIEQVDPTTVLRIRLTRGVHLVLPALPTTDAFLFGARQDRRVIFLLPWYGRTLLGTTDTDYNGNPDRVRVEPSDVAYLLAEANRVLNGVTWREEDVISSFAGLRTLREAEGATPSAVSREWSLEQPLERLLVPVGGKFTSARRDAALTVDRVMELLEREVVPSSTHDTPFPWCPPGRSGSWGAQTLNEGLDLGLDEETAVQCQLRHGTRIGMIYDWIRGTPQLARRIMPEAPFCLAEVVHAASDEMARTLEDVLRRRVPLLLLCHVPAETQCEVAELVGRALGWPEERRRKEVGSLVWPPTTVRRAHETA